MIELKNLNKIYKTDGIETSALDGINLSIEKGSFSCLAGPSGSGKTTLLNLIGSLDKPTTGAILYQGKDITAIPTNKLAGFRLKSIGFIFQSYNLINTLTAAENVEYVLLLQGVGLKERRAKAKELLAKVGLSEHINKFVNHLSGGQQQRVAVARAIVSEPQIILADEPTANLDSVTAEHLLDLMKQLNQEQGLTFLFSTHDKMVMEKANTVYQMKDGHIVD